jgi:hypothetical protein
VVQKFESKKFKMEQFAQVVNPGEPTNKPTEKKEKDLFVVEEEAWKKSLVFAQLDQIAAHSVCVNL